MLQAIRSFAASFWSSTWVRLMAGVGVALTGALVFAVVAISAFTMGFNKALDSALSPPSSTTMYTILTRAIGLSEIQRTTGSATDTPEAAFGTDLTSTQKTDAYVQQFTIRNTSGDVDPTLGTLLCYGEVAWSGASTCNTLCAASAFTCDDSTTDGTHLSPGQVVATRYDGTSCVCVIGQAAGTAFQSTRVVR